jgi:hypothetical protein
MTIDELTFSTYATDDGKWVGVVEELPKLRTRPQSNRMDAIEQIVRLASRRLAHINTGGSTK